MSKQSVERPPQPARASDNPTPSDHEMRSDAGRQPRYLQPYQLNGSPSEDLRRLTSSPLTMLTRFSFLNPALLLRRIGLLALLITLLGTLSLRQAWNYASQPWVAVFILSILVIMACFAYTTRPGQQYSTLVLVGAIGLETLASVVGIWMVGFSLPLYFSVVPFFVVVGHAQATFTTRLALGLTALVWLGFLATLITSDEELIRGRFWTLLFLMSVPFLVVTLVARFLGREARQRARLIEALNELQQSEERYRQVTDRANDAIIIMDSDARLSFVNPRLIELSGYAETELLGHRLNEFLTNDSRQVLGQALSRRPARTERGNKDKDKDNKEPAILTLEFIRKNGSHLQTEATAATLLDHQNKPNGWVAIARDVTERVRMREQVERRNRDLTALNAILSTAGQSLDLERLLNDVVTTLVEVLKADVAGITLIEEGTRLLKVGAYKGLSDTVVRAVTNISVNENRSLTSQVATTGQPLLIDDLSQSLEAQQINSGELVDTMGLRSFLAVPITSRNEILGVVSLISQQRGAFQPDDQALLVAIGKSLAVSIENARLYGTSQSQVREMTCLADIARAINLSQSLGQTLSNIATSISTTLEYKACAISLFDPDQLSIQAYGGYGMPSGFFDRINNMVRQGQVSRDELMELPLFRTLTLTQPTVFPVKPLAGPLQDVVAEAVAQGWHSVLTAPFNIQGRPTGVISCYSSTNIPPPASELYLMVTIANQTSLAVQNAFLYREQQRRADQLRAVSEIGRQIGAILNLDELLPFITKLLQQTFDYYMVGIFLTDQDDPKRLVLRAMHGWNPAMAVVGRSFDLSEGRTGLVNWVGVHGEALVVPDVSKDARFMEYDEAGLVKSEMVVPIKRGGQVIGVIDLASTLLKGFDDSDLAIMQALAEQVSIALENARLYTEVNRIVVELTNTNVELEEANRHKSEFLANMSHELRTPLNAIIGFSEVLQDHLFGDLNEKQDRYVLNILTSGRHLLTLVNDVLDLAKVEAGRMELRLEAFAPEEATQDVENILSVSATRKGLVIENQFEPGLPLLKADKSKYKQILYNLLSNAVKFTPEKGRITTGIYRHYEDGQEFLAIWVRDTGIGINKEDHLRIFEEFRQVDSSYSRQHQGTGLGLALSKRLVELHGGRIWVDSEFGTGSLFTFLLPLSPVLPQVIKAQPTPLEPIDRLLEAHAQNRLEKQISRDKQTQKLPTIEREKPRLARPPTPLFQPENDDPRPLVLIVDDDDRAADLLGLYLAEGGYRVERARNGQEALEKARWLQPALITLDVLLPGKDGWQVLTDLRQQSPTRTLPVLMVGIGQPPDQLPAQAQGFLSKPVRKDQLLQLIARTIRS